MLERIKAIIQAHAVPATFMALVEERFVDNPKGRVLIRKALRAATLAHKGKTRLDGFPALSHPLAVATLLLECGKVTEPEAVAAGLLHLFLEEVGWDFDRLQLTFGMKVAQHIWYVSKKTGENNENWEERTKLAHERLLYAPQNTQLLKIFDRFNNLLSIWALPEKKQERMLRDTVLFYIPLARRIGIFEAELLEAVRLASRVNIR